MAEIDAVPEDTSKWAKAVCWTTFISSVWWESGVSLEALPIAEVGVVSVISITNRKIAVRTCLFIDISNLKEKISAVS
jgi:hypothetical protein